MQSKEHTNICSLLFMKNITQVYTDILSMSFKSNDFTMKIEAREISNALTLLFLKYEKQTREIA